MEGSLSWHLDLCDLYTVVGWLCYALQQSTTRAVAIVAEGLNVVKMLFNEYSGDSKTLWGRSNVAELSAEITNSS